MHDVIPAPSLLAGMIAAWLTIVTGAPCRAQSETFVAPPATIDDITAILDQEKPDPKVTAARIALADAVPPAKAGDHALAEFYFRRAQARSTLGRSYDAIADCELAMRYGKGSDYEKYLSRYEQMRWRELLTVGEFDRAIDLMNTQVANFQKQHRTRLFNLNQNLARQYIDREELDRAETYLRRNRALFEEVKSGRALVAPRPAHLANIEEINGNLLETRRRYAEAEAAYQRVEAYMNDTLEHRFPEAVKSDQSAKSGSGNRFLRSVTGYDTVPRLTTERALDSAVASKGRMKVLQGRVAEGEADVRSALLSSLRKDGKYNSQAAHMIRHLADVMNEEGRNADAEKLLRAAIDIYKAIGYPASVPSVVFANSELAQTFILERRQDEAFEIYGRIERVTAGWPLWRQEQLNPLSRAWLLMGKGRAADVVELATRELERERARSGETSLQTALVRGTRAAALGQANREVEAVGEFKVSIPTLLAVSHEYDDEEGTVAVGRANRIRLVIEAYIAFLARNPAPATGDAGEETLGLADILRGQAVQRALAASSARAAAKDLATAEFVRREQDLKKQVGGSLRALNNLLAMPSAQRDERVVKTAQAEIAKLQAAHAAARRDIDRRFPRYGNLIDPAPVRSGQIQALLHSGEVLMSFYFGEFESFAWVVAKHGPVEFRTVAMTLGDSEAKIGKLREALEPNVGSVGDIPPFDTAIAYELYEQLLKPSEVTWRPAKHLIVVTNGPLGLLPLGVLPTAPTAIAVDSGPPFANYRSVPWLARTHAVTMVPSTAALQTLRELPQDPRPRAPLVGFGDPYFGPDQAAKAEPKAATTKAVAATRGPPLRLRPVAQMTGVDSAELALMPRLPETADELRSMAVALKADPTKALHLGKDANERTVKSIDLSNYRTVAFATHGLLPGDLNGLTQPALALTAPKVAGVEGDGLLTTDKILALKLDADWVVLSACNSGAGSEAGTEAASGLARAFFYAGTRAVLVTNWPVHSASARDLVTDLFRRLAADPKLTRDEALRQAMMAMVDGAGFTDQSGKTLFTYAHPLFWAPYSVIGDSGGT